MFSSRREWFAHELEFHRNDARDSHDTPQLIPGNELRLGHDDHSRTTVDRTPAMTRFRPTPDGTRVKSKCPLCLRLGVTIRSHLSKHLQTIAIFSLPRLSSGILNDVASDQALEWDSEAGSQSFSEEIEWNDNEDAGYEVSEDTDGTLSAMSSSQVDTSQIGGRWADFNLTSPQNGQAPLLNAASLGNLSLVRSLLAEPTTNVEVRDKRDQTPLSRAAEAGATEVVQFLVNVRGVDLNTRDRIFKRTPLNWAAGNGHAAVVRTLLDCRGVDPNVGDSYSRSPVWRASTAGHVDVVRVLAAHSDVNVDAPDRYDRTPIAWAGAGNHVTIMKMLANRGVDFSHKDNEGVAPLARAAISGSTDAVRFLLSCHDITVDLRDETEKTALMRAAEGGHLMVTRLLLESGADVNARDQNGKDALMLATEEGHGEMADMLIEHRANLSNVDHDGRTLSTMARGR